jgi:hypothetical protein
MTDETTQPLFANGLGEKLQVGDTVFLGSGTVHWVIDRLSVNRDGHPMAVLRSGLSGRRIVARTAPLRHHPVSKEEK